MAEISKMATNRLGINKWSQLDSTEISITVGFLIAEIPPHNILNYQLSSQNRQKLCNKSREAQGSTWHKCHSCKSSSCQCVIADTFDNQIVHLPSPQTERKQHELTKHDTITVNYMELHIINNKSSLNCYGIRIAMNYRRGLNHNERSPSISMASKQTDARMETTEAVSVCIGHVDFTLSTEPTTRAILSQYFSPPSL